MDPRINVQVSGYDGMTLTGRARGHVVMIDRTQEKGGSDSGPMGGELLLLALGGCYMSTFLAALRDDASHIDSSLVNINVQGHIASSPSRFSKITVFVSAPKEYRELVAKPLLMAERGCLVHNTLKGSMQVQFDYSWNECEQH